MTTLTSPTLTGEQLAEYHDRGFVVVENVFSREELEDITEDLERVRNSPKAAAHIMKEGHQGSIYKLAQASPKAGAFCADDRILDLISPIVHPGIAIYSAKMVAKEPFEPTICHWHQDDAYYAKNSQSQTRMSVWIPLQDATVEQGCLQVIPHSHKLGLQPFTPQKDGACRLKIDTPVDLSQREYCPVKAGSMILFSSLLWHASEGNTTERRRWAFIVSYQEATVQGGNGAQWQILRPA